MSEVSAIVAGSICLVNPGPRISDRLQHELSYPNPAYNVTFITKQHHARENIPSWISCMEEFPDGSVRIPRGAVKELKAVLDRCETTVRWIDRRSLGTPVPRVDVPLRDYQQEALGKLMQSVQALAMMPCGCHAPGQLILMADGSYKRVESIATNDLLMGPGGAKRRVLELHRGTDEMFRVTPTKGAPFIVNKQHVLSLVCIQSWYDGAGTTVDVPVSDWLTWSKRKRDCYKMFRSAVRMPDRELSIDPYFLGILLGDGSLQHGVSIHKPDQEIEALAQDEARRWGLRFARTVAPNKTCPRLSLTTTPGGRADKNPLWNAIKTLGLSGTTSDTKFVPVEYLRSGDGQRAAVLAGLLDADGHMSHGEFDFISKSDQLAEDVCFLARSLGLAAYKSRCTKSCQTGATGTYARVSISGDTTILPLRIARKIPSARRQIKNVLRVGFSVEPVGRGDYYGFSVDGDGRYLLDDFTVTHNSGKTRLGVSLIGARAVSTLVLVHTKEILEQWVEDIRKLLGMQAGVVADGEARWAPVTVAMVRTLATQIASSDDGPWSEFGMCLCDEAHHVPAKTTFLGILPYVPAKYRYGLTATDRDDELNKVMYWTFQTKVVDVEARYLIKKGFLVPAEIVEVDTDFEFTYDGPDKKRIAQLTRSLVADHARNDLICKLAADHGARGETVLVLSNNKAHCRKLAKRIVEMGTKAIAIVGGLSKKDKAGKPVEETVVHTKRQRKKAMQQMRDGTERVFVATSLADEGLDVPRLACIILALPGASRRATRQQLGRVMRPFDGKYPVLYDLVDRKVDTLKRRLSDRRAVYRDIGLI